MDCYTTDSDVVDFFIPTVKKGHRNKDKVKSYIPGFTKQPDLHILRKLCKTKHTKYNSNDGIEGAPSTSVVLKKTIAEVSKRKIIADNIYKDDTSSEVPLIKVTVIPKAVDNHGSRLFNKRRPIVKRVQSTISNQESSIRSKNFYLVVTGRKADKIYEIKTTGSEKLSNNQSSNRLKYEDISFRKLSNYKQVIESLNMDKKKKKDKKKKTNIPQQQDSRVSLVDEIFGGAGLMLQECICSNAKRKSTFNNVKPHRSRLRFIGQFGSMNNEKYVINYATTVDNDSGVRNFNEVEEKSKYNEASDSTSRGPETTNCTSSYSISNVIYNNKKYFRTQRDSNVQANLLDPSTCRPLPRNRALRQESQSTQVDMDALMLPDRIKKYSCRDQTIQCYCNCSNVTGVLSSSTDAANKSCSTKDTKNPVVIISVYPKEDTDETLNTSHSSVNQRVILPMRTDSNVKQPDKNNKNNMNAYRSRSPSPIRRNNTKDQSFNRIVEARFLSAKKKNSNVRSTSNNNQKRSPSPNELNNAAKPKFFKKFPVTFGTRDSKDMRTTLKNKNYNDVYQKTPTICKKDAANGSSISRNQSPSPKRNVDGKYNGYNTMWNQRNVNRNSRTRKVSKEQDSHKSSDGEYGSMENFLMLSEDNGDVNKRSLSQTLCYSHLTSPLLNVHLPQNPPTFSTSNNTGQVMGPSCEGLSHTPLACSGWLLEGPNCTSVNAANHVTCIFDFKRTTTAFCETSQRTNTTVGNSDSSDEVPKRSIKFTQTSRSYDDLYDSQSNANFFAPIKHYHGDSCNIVDPLERDKEIRKLLGLECRHTNPKPITQEYYSGIFCRDAQQRCRKSEKKNCKKTVTCDKPRTLDCKCSPVKVPTVPKNRSCKLIKTKTTTTQYDIKNPCCSPAPSVCSVPNLPPPEKQQLILNRNIQVYLQIEQFTKQKPIMLTRKQYDKLKKTIQSTVKLKKYDPPKQDKTKKDLTQAYSVVSEGQVKKAPKSKCCVIRDKGMQTKKNAKKSKKMTTPSSKTSATPSCVCVEIQTICNSFEKQICNCMLLDKQNIRDISKPPRDVLPRRTMSSLEIRYANVAFRRVTFSSSNVGQMRAESLHSNEVDITSLDSMFKHENKMATPTLGTSAYSVYSEATGSGRSLKYLISPRDSKQKKPFLRRLMSCLVMHSARASNVKLPCGLTSKVSGVNSSIDSYYISSSLGAIEVTSSMYDTSASFYSNHTIVPINKIKRGFLSSVRGFLTSRRS